MRKKNIYESPAAEIREFCFEAGIASSDDGMSSAGDIYYDSENDNIDF